MIYKIAVKNDTVLLEFYAKAMKVLNDFYQLNWVYNRPNIFVLSSKKDIEKSRENMGAVKHKGVARWISNGGVYVVSKELYEELITPIDPHEQYLMLIKHELSHLFFQHLSQSHFRPDWLWEGCAIYLSGQNKYKKKPETFIDFLRFYEKNVEGNVYQESGFVIHLLVEKFGKDKLISLIKNIKDVKNMEEFQQLFSQIYRIELSYEAINKLWLSSN